MANQTLNQEQSTNKKIILTMPELLYNKILAEKESFSYETVQEVIREALRDKFLRGTGLPRGRPKKENYTKALGMKKVFTKKGGKIVEI